MTEPRKLRVFLCHSSQDKPIVRELYQRLNAEGWIDPWLDEEKLLPGHDWDMEIEKAVESADAVIVSLSGSSINKEGYIQKEIRKVLDISDQKPDGSIFIVPLRLENCEPPRRLKKWQYIDYFPSNQRSVTVIKILTSLKLRAKKLNIDISFTEFNHNNSLLTEGAKKLSNLTSAAGKKYSIDKESWVEWAGMEKELGNYQRARELYQRATEITPRSVEAWLNWAEMEKVLRNHQRARELYQRATEINPRSVEAWLNWAEIEKELGNYQRARELYQRTTEINPQSVEAWLNWAGMEKELGNHQRARELYQRAFELK